MRLRKLCLLSWLVVLGIAAAAAGAPSEDRPQRPQPNPKLAFTNPAEAGADFAYQGEYHGYYGAWGYGPEVGLQVVARGEGRFEATLYGGGLPGANWDRRTRRELAGARQGSVLVLYGNQESIVITPGNAIVYDLTGRLVATLAKARRFSRTLGASPPPGAVVLFDGTSLEHLASGAKMTADGLLQEGARTQEPVGDFQLHLEFQLPFMPYARGQGRGNSGVYIQRRYEVQILDSFGLKGEANECGGLYRQTPPEVNMCLPPLSWQTYDIFFSAPRWNERGEKIANARITLLHNGITVHRNREIPTKTGNGRPESPEPLPILFQDHGDPVRFRNIWLKPLGTQQLAGRWCEGARE